MRGSSVSVATPAGSTQIELPLPGLYNVYNALAALASALALGVPLDVAARGIASTESAFGRVETIPIGAQALSILLIKNPAGANEVLRTLRLEASDDGGLDLWMALNDRIADGRDVSWIWDADFEVLAGGGPDGHVRGDPRRGDGRAAEVRRRLRGHHRGRSRHRGVARRARPGGGPTVFALPTYTALIELRRLLSARGLAKEYWQ